MAVLFTDDFDRANGALGANWTNLNASFVISGNVAVPTSYAGDALSVVSAVTWPNDQYAQIVVAGLAVHAQDIGIGVALRAADASNFYRITVNTSHCDVGKVVTGSYSSITDLGAGFVPGDTLYAEVQGNTLKVFRNGSQFGSNVTGDAALASGKAGLVYSSTAATPTADNFVGGDFSAAAVSDEAALRTAHTPVTWRT